MKRVFHGVWSFLSLRKKRDVWTLVWMLFIGFLAYKHAISDMAVAALATPIVAKIFTDHREKMAQLPPKGQV